MSTGASPATACTRCGLVILLLPALLTAMDIPVLFTAAPETTEAPNPYGPGCRTHADHETRANPTGFENTKGES